MAANCERTCFLPEGAWAHGFFPNLPSCFIGFHMAGSSGGSQTTFKATGSGIGQELGTRSSSKSSLEGPKTHIAGAEKDPGVPVGAFTSMYFLLGGWWVCGFLGEREVFLYGPFVVDIVLLVKSWNIMEHHLQATMQVVWGPFWGRWIPGTKKKSSRGRRNPEEATGSSGGHIQWTLFDATTCLGLLLSPEIRVLNRKRWKDIGRRKLNDGRRMGTWHMALQGLIWLLHSDRWEICSWTFSGFRRWQQQLAFARYLRRHPSRTNGCKSYVRDYKNIFQNSEGPLSIPSWDQGTWGTRTWQKETIKDYRV